MTEFFGINPRDRFHMMEQQLYFVVLYGFLGFALITFLTLFFITAPYGRHTRSGWGPLISDTPAWVIMESPASILFLVYFLTSSRPINATLVFFLVIWQIHYFHRSFIYPFQLKSNEKMSFSIMLFGTTFNVVNTYIQGSWLFKFAPPSAYSAAWLTDPRFLIGVLGFALGFSINKHADAVLRGLWASGDPGYKIPQGGMYRYISCPNYFGEIVTWVGWAVMTWSLAGLFFAVWTAANLVPRARSNHRWYLDKYPDYPRARKAIIPFLF